MEYIERGVDVCGNINAVAGADKDSDINMDVDVNRNRDTYHDIDIGKNIFRCRRI